jgi:hypothetical protein
MNKHLKQKLMTFDQHYKDQLAYLNLVNGLDDLSSVINLKSLPGSEFITAINEIPVQNGFFVDYNGHTFVGVSKKRAEETCRKNQLDYSFIRQCKVQQIFKSPGDQQFIGVHDPNPPLVTDQQLLDEINSSKVNFQRENIGEIQDKSKLQDLRIGEISEKYGFKIEIPDESDPLYEEYQVLKEALLDMVKTVITSFHDIPLNTKILINGGKDK